MSNPADGIVSKCFAGGAGCAVAGFLTNPCDVVKIRNQQYGGRSGGRSSTILIQNPVAETSRTMTQAGMTSSSGSRSNGFNSNGRSNGSHGGNGGTVPLRNSLQTMRPSMRPPINNAAKIQADPYGSFFGAFRTIAKQEGIWGGLMKGARATVLRESTYSSVRMGFYEPIKKGIRTLTGVTDDGHVVVKWGDEEI
jgi:hypothetical protein